MTFIENLFKAAAILKGLIYLSCIVPTQAFYYTLKY
jgi:hypothetical protein